MAKRTPVEKTASKSVSRADAKSVRMDGWINILTGLGVKEKDRRESSYIQWQQMTETDADELYAASDVASKLVDEVVNEAFREGYELRAKKDFTPEEAAAITDEGARLEVDEKIQEAWKYARLYGGAGIIALSKDITNLTAPLNLNSIAKIESLLVLSRWELVAGEIESDIRSPNHGKPKYYSICPRSGSTSTQEKVHHSRVLLFDGSFLPKMKFVKNQYWHDSVLNRAKDPIRDYDGAMASLSATLSDFSTAVMKIKDLTRLVAEDKDDLVMKRLTITNMSRSVNRTIIMDAENESFEYQDRQLSGVDAAVTKISSRLVVASGMPHTKILGESPAGSNATGNSTTKDWYDVVRAAQENYLDKRLITLWKWILSAKQGPTKGSVPDGLKAIYAELWQEPESVRAEVKLKQAQTDQIYIADGVLNPNEVAVSRFGSGEYSTETQLVMKRDPKEDVEREEEEPTPEKPEEEKAPKEGKGE